MIGELCIKITDENWLNQICNIDTIGFLNSYGVLIEPDNGCNITSKQK